MKRNNAMALCAAVATGLVLAVAGPEAKYRDAAVGIARTYLKLQGADGT